VDKDEFRRQLDALNAEYRSGLPAKLVEIDALWAKSSGTDATLLRALHSMAGSAKTFGVKGVSEAAAAAEHYLAPFCERSKVPDSAQRAEFERLLGALKRVATDGAP
jgi:HPt (histidine-containing phosphotransfer) domain-containing protein